VFIAKRFLIWSSLTRGFFSFFCKEVNLMSRFFILRSVILISWASVLFLTAVDATWASTYYCFTGSFTDGSEVQRFYFTLFDSLTSSEPMSFKTWHYNGGTNWAGQTIAGGNFDPTLGLYYDVGTLIAYNDDLNPPTERDSLISRGDLPLTLNADDYYLELRAYGGTLGGRGSDWAVDIEGPDSGMYMTGVSTVSGSTLEDLYLGSDVLNHQAWLSLNAGQSLNFAGNLYLGFKGFGGIVLDDAALQCQSLSLGCYGPSYSTGIGVMNVSGQNAHLSVSDYLTIGESPSPVWNWSTLRIYGGALVDGASAGAIIGRLAGSDGWVMVNNSGMPADVRTHWNSSAPIIVGLYGKGGLVIGEGAWVSSPGGAIAALPGSANSYVTLLFSDDHDHRAQWDLSGNLEVGQGDTGTLSVGDGGFVNIPNHDLIIYGLGTVQQQGGTIYAHSLNNTYGGTFTHSNGILEVNGGYFNPVAPGTADYAIDGPLSTDYPNVYLHSGATLTLTGRLDVGRDHNGYMAVLSGSHVTSRLASIGSYAGADGYVFVYGSNAIWTVNGTTPDGCVMWIGGDDYGSLNVVSQGKVELTGAYSRALIGNAITGYGTMYVTGSGSRFESREDIIVGYSGHGILNIFDGGTVVADPYVSSYYPTPIGTCPNSRGEVYVDGVATDGSRSQWIRRGPLETGAYGRGEVSITNGALISSLAGYIAGYTGSAGSKVTLEGTGPAPDYFPAEWYVDWNIHVGGCYYDPGDSGTLTVKQGGWVHTPGLLHIWSPGTVELLGGRITVGSFINDGGTFTHTDGLLEINGGTFDPGVTDYVLDGAAADDLPTVVLFNGATANITGDITMGNVYHGNMEISGGSHLTCHKTVYLGLQATSTLGSNLIIDGTNSTLTLAGGWGMDIFVGTYGKGFLTLRNGGKVVTNDRWIFVNSLSTMIFENGQVEGGAVNLLGGTLCGHGQMDAYIVCNDGTIETSYSGLPLSLNNFLSINSGHTLWKTGAEGLYINDHLNWWASSTFEVQEGSVLMNCTAPSIVGESVILKIDSMASVEAGGAYDPFTEQSNPNLHVSIENNGIFRVTAGDKQISSIIGTGDTAVMAGSLTADSIVQNVLTIGPGAKVVIRPLSSSPVTFQPVPEPGAIMLMALALLCWGLAINRAKK
jgi:T5SS/PEP-CTERM-associated repeat protein